MKNTLPGNPNAAAADSEHVHEQNWYLIQAQLALAYEQRTANLLAMLVAKDSNGAAMFPEEYDKRQEIKQRMGIQ